MKKTKILAATLGLIFTADLALARTINVCSMTLNSDDEINVFRSQLSRQADVNYNFIEIGQDVKKHCQLKTQCDVLVVSGHFSGSFFGTKGLLPIHELESLTCQASCDGIFHRPQKVYLFGCNTLAGKDKDRRTPEQYYEVLREDHFPSEQALLMTNFRYSPFGSSFYSRMSQIFARVPTIYGFSSKAPLGAIAGPNLNRYFNQMASNYSQVLQTNSSQEDMRLTSNFKDMTSTSGYQGAQSALCAFNGNDSTLQKLLFLEEKFQTGDVLENAAIAESFIKRVVTQPLDAAEHAVLMRIRNSTRARQTFFNYMASDDRFSLMMQIKSLDIMEQLGYVTSDQKNQIIQSKTLKVLLKPVLNQLDVDILKSLKVSVEVPLNMIPADAESRPFFYQAMSELKVKNNDVSQELIRKFRATTSFAVKSRILEGLMRTQMTAEQLHFLLDVISSEAESIMIRKQATAVIGSVQPSNNHFHERWLQVLQTVQQDSVRVFMAMQTRYFIGTNASFRNQLSTIAESDRNQEVRQFARLSTIALERGY